MPSNTIRMNNPPEGTLILPANAYRVYLEVNSAQSQNDVVLVGNQLATGIPLLTQFSNQVALLYNVVGSAMRAEVYVLTVTSFGPLNVMEIYRTPGGIT